MCFLTSKKYSNTLQSEIDRRLENILKNGTESARVLRLGSTKNVTEANEYKFIEVIWCVNYVVRWQKWFQKLPRSKPQLLIPMFIWHQRGFTRKPLEYQQLNNYTRRKEKACRFICVNLAQICTFKLFKQIFPLFTQINALNMVH